MNPAALVITLVTTPFILLLLVLILVLSGSVRKAKATRYWTPTQGQILASSVSSHMRRNSNGTHTEIFRPEVAYQYLVNGQVLRSTQINYGAIGGESFSGWAQGIVDKYPAGADIKVYFNPLKPEEAVLEHVSGAGNVALTIILTVIEVGLVALLVAGLTGRMN